MERDRQQQEAVLRAFFRLVFKESVSAAQPATSLREVPLVVQMKEQPEGAAHRASGMPAVQVALIGASQRVETLLHLSERNAAVARSSRSSASSARSGRRAKGRNTPSPNPDAGPLRDRASGHPKTSVAVSVHVAPLSTRTQIWSRTSDGEPYRLAQMQVEAHAVDGADQTLANAVERGDIPGVVAGAADANQVVYQGAFGQRALDQPAAMTLDTVFRIASMTKAVTAIAALQLVEQGRLALEEPVGDRMAELGAVQVLDGFDAAGSPRLRPPRRPITLRHLLTHTPGFGYTTWDSALLRLEQQTAQPLGSLETPLVFDPGERWEYRSRQRLERTTRRARDWRVSRGLFPACTSSSRWGMHDTRFILGDDQRARLAGRHQRQADGSVQLTARGSARPASFNGGGGLYSTGPDFLRLLRMLLANGTVDSQRVLRPESVADLARNHIGELTVERLPSVRPDLSNDVELFPGHGEEVEPGRPNQYDQPVPGRRSAGSWTWAGLFNTYFWVDPTRGVTGLPADPDPALLRPAGPHSPGSLRSRNTVLGNHRIRGAPEAEHVSKPSVDTIDARPCLTS